MSAVVAAAVFQPTLAWAQDPGATPSASPSASPAVNPGLPTVPNAPRIKSESTSANRAKSAGTVKKTTVPKLKAAQANSALAARPARAGVTQFTMDQRGGVPGGLTIEQAFEAALKRSETLAIDSETLKQTKENETQAKGALFPTISGAASLVHDHYPTGNPVTSINNGDQRTTKLTLDQPLFRGLKEYATIRQRKALVESQVYALRDAARLLFNNLSTAYYNVLAFQADEQNYQTEILIYQRRTKELEHFLNIGRSRETDLLTFQSSLSSLEAQLESTHGQLEQARDVLAYFTGMNRDTALSDQSTTMSETDLGNLLARIDDRPDVQSALASAKAAVEGIPIARSGHLPSVDLVADYYHDHPNYLTGSEDWDIGLTLTLPIYEGGIVQSQVRQAQSVATQSDLQVLSARRLAEQEIRSDYDAYLADGRQVSKLQDTVELAAKNYDSELRDYRNGLVTNLDVLTAINAYQDSQRTLDHQKWMMNLDLVKLQAATGQLAQLAVNPPVK